MNSSKASPVFLASAGLARLGPRVYLQVWEENAGRLGSEILIGLLAADYRVGPYDEIRLARIAVMHAIRDLVTPDLGLAEPCGVNWTPSPFCACATNQMVLIPRLDILDPVARADWASRLLTRLEVVGRPVMATRLLPWASAPLDITSRFVRGYDTSNMQFRPKGSPGPTPVELAADTAASQAIRAPLVGQVARAGVGPLVDPEVLVEVESRLDPLAFLLAHALVQNNLIDLDPATALGAAFAASANALIATGLGADKSVPGAKTLTLTRGRRMRSPVTRSALQRT